MLTAGHIIAKPDPTFQRWHRQYSNTSADDPTIEAGGPNYPRTIGRLVAGLFQQAPVTMDIADTATPAMTAEQLADLTDRGVKRGAAESVVYIRPAQVAGRWVPGVLGGSQVDAVWEHDVMTSAVVWKLHGKDNNMRAVTEHYSTDDAGVQTVDVQLWHVKKVVVDGGGYELVSEITVLDQVDNGVLDPLIVAVAELAGSDRRLFAWAWDFEDGKPVPIHYTNEHLVDQLSELHAVEQDDSLLPRNIVALSEESAGTDASFGSKLKGFVRGRNLVKIPPDQLSQHGTDSVAKVLRLEDDLTPRDRIERKEIGLYEACGISGTTFGRNVSGRSDSGAAKRADSQLTLTTIAGPARRWAGTLTAVAEEIARLAGSGSASGVVQVTEGLKTSADERADLISTLRNADAMSIEQAVKEANPDWDDPKVAAEVARIRTDNMIATAPDV